MKKKILALVLVVVLALTAITGTLAYFTDTKDVTNIFTVGSVSIDLIESQYHRVNAGKGTTNDSEPIIGGYLWAANVNLEGTKENTPDAANYAWSGTYFSDEQIKKDAKTYKDEYFAKESALMVPGDNVRKNPYIINTGANDAYVRLRALIPADLFVILDNGPSYWVDQGISEGAFVCPAIADYKNTDPETFATNNAYAKYRVEKDGVNYIVFEFTYQKPLASGAMTFWNAWGNIAIDKNATAEDLAKVESFNVIFEADAIQAEGFANAAAAFAAFDAE